MNESKPIEVWITSIKHTWHLTEKVYGDTAVLTAERVRANPAKWDGGLRSWQTLFVQTVCSADARRCWFDALERFRRCSRWNVFTMDDPLGVSWYSLRRYWRRCGCTGIIHAVDAAIEFPLDDDFDWYGLPKRTGSEVAHKKE